MTKNNDHSTNSTTFFPNYQLFLPMDIGVNISESSPVRVISKLLEGLDYRYLMQAYSKNKGRKHKIEADKMFFIIAYAMFDSVSTTRAIEKNCRENINYMWILRGSSAPDHNTVARFISSCKIEIEDLFYQLINKLIELNEIDLENVFIDGTKIEANANKYTFVWKKAVNKFYEKLKIKVNDFWHSFNENNNTGFNDIYEIEKHLEKEILDRNIEFVYGKGVRKTQQQRDYETVTSYIAKENEYNMHLKICGSRNSYSKTDNDATFMRMKDDYMKNGQLKPAYNLQIGVNSEYIVGLDLFPNPTDVRTLIPFLSVLESKNLKFKNIVADAGYESEENYEYLFNNNYTPYIKPQNYEKQKTQKFKQDISKAENMSFNEETDTYTCANNQKLEFSYTSKQKNRSGYISEKKVYECNNCEGCPFAVKCKNTPHNKKLYVADNFLRFRKQSQENIATEKGIILRMNRSIQVEGAFGVLKQNMNFKRFKYRERSKTKVEVLLFAIGYNLRKYVHKKVQGREGMKLHKLAIN